MKNLFILLLLSSIIFVSCQKHEEENMSFIDKQTIVKVIKSLKEKYGDKNIERMKLGINQAASFWTEKDGSKKDFYDFCISSFVNAPDTLDLVFNRLQRNFESIEGHFGKVVLDLNWASQVVGDVPLPCDIMFSGYDPNSNLTNDFFNNKIAFYTIINFPFYSLAEKEAMGEKWTRKEWAYARMGDMFSARIPSDLLMKVSEASAKSSDYIDNYYIYAGNLVDDKGQTSFPKDLRLITHWNLRDEIKSQYAKPDGLPRQKMIYEVMKRIIDQSIPQSVINSDKYTWDPYKNITFANNQQVTSTPEPNTRYQMLLDNFKARKEIDKYSPNYPTFIDRAFDQGLEIPQKQVEELFIKLLSSGTVNKVASLIKSRLGRDLQPFDIWYDGFKSRGTISEDYLNTITKAKYPNEKAFYEDIPNILKKLGFTAEKAAYIQSKVQVDPSRGAGHAAGAYMKGEKAHLRTHITKDGMDYKGYNIAVHEFGHNVEQTTTLYDVDYYMLMSVPNTAFTEAVAFLFQKRDLDLLGLGANDNMKDYMLALDDFWSAYEIMGVSLVDMGVWKWMYEHPEATSDELKLAVISIAKDIWNKYYAGVMGMKDQPILAVYSHMIDNPLYLSAYPIGHLIEFQEDQYMKGKNFADELTRMLLQGRIIPQIWMKGAVGSKISVQAMLDATEEAMKNIK